MENRNSYEDSVEQEYEATNVSENSTEEKKKQKLKGTKKDKNQLVFAGVLLIVTLIGWMVMVMLEDRMINNQEMTQVVVAATEVPVGIELTTENMATYFVMEDRPANQIPESIVYTDAMKMIGQITCRNIHAKEMVTSDCFVKNSIYDELEDGVELSLELGSLGQSVSGILRAGDLVDIMVVVEVEQDEWQLEENVEKFEGDDIMLPIESSDDLSVQQGMEPREDKMTGEELLEGEAIVIGADGMVVGQNAEELTTGITGDYVADTVAENIRVTGVYNSGGEKTDVVEAAGGTMVATVINVHVPENLVEAILLAQEEGKITLVKVDEEKRLSKEEASDTTKSSIKEEEIDEPETENENEEDFGAVT